MHFDATEKRYLLNIGTAPLPGPERVLVHGCASGGEAEIVTRSANHAALEPTVLEFHRRTRGAVDRARDELASDAAGLGRAAEPAAVAE